MVEAASRIVSQHSQDALQRRVMSSGADALMQRQSLAHHSARRQTGSQPQHLTSNAAEKQKAQPVVLKAELGNSGSLALLKSLRRSDLLYWLFTRAI